MPVNSVIVSDNWSVSSTEKRPLVSISIITYNHEDYIEEAIESVLQQKVSFDYELIIGDDCSSDKTPEILKSYQKKYPDRIQLILHPRRYDCIPGRINNITNLYACRGKYIAMLDGDDAWLDTDKLEKQVSFLEANPEFTLCFHDALFSYPDDYEIIYSAINPMLSSGQTVFTHQEVIKSWFIQTSSMLFRNDLIKEFPEWFWQVYSADYAIQLMISSHGKLKYMPDILMKRRFHELSFSSMYNKTFEHYKKRIDEYYLFDEYFKNFKNHRAGILAKSYRHWTRKFLKEGNLSESLKFGLKSCKYYMIASVFPQTVQELPRRQHIN